MVAVAAEEDALKRFDMARVVRRTFAVLRRGVAMYGAAAFVFVVVPQTLLFWGINAFNYARAYAEATGLFTLAAYVGLAGAVLGAASLQGALVHAAAADLSGRRAGLSEMFVAGWDFCLSLARLSLLMWLALGLAFSALIAPGAYFATAWVVAAPAMVLEGLGARDSLRRSSDLTQGVRWPVFFLSAGCVLAGWLAPPVAGELVVEAVLGEMAAQTAGSALTSAAAQFVLLVSSAGQALVGAVLALICGVGVVVIYWELATVDDDPLADVFD